MTYNSETRRKEYIQNREKYIREGQEYYSINREAKLARHREYYEANKEKWKLKGEKARQRVKYRKPMIIEMMGGKCADCSGVFPQNVYDFHHLDRTTKEKGISYILKCSFTRLLTEITKCVLLCANCHRMRHSEDHGKTNAESG